MSVSFKESMMKLEQILDIEVLEKFRSEFKATLENKKDQIELSAEAHDWKGFDCPTDLYEFQMHLEDESTLLIEFSRLGNELCIMALFRAVEIRTKSLVKHHCNNINVHDLFKINKLKSALPFALESVSDYSAFDELRLLNNAIKHEGIVSSELAKKFPLWNSGAELVDLEAAYERLAPKVGNYFQDLADRLQSANSK